MRLSGNSHRTRRVLLALIVVVSLLFVVILYQHRAPQVVQAPPTRQHAVAGESGENSRLFIPLVTNSAPGVAGSGQATEPVAAPPPVQAGNAPPPPPVTLPTSGGPIYWGAYIPDVPYQMDKLEEFEAKYKKGVSIVHWGQPWIMNGKSQRFQTAEFEKVRQHGAIPMINWLSWDFTRGANQPDFQLADIIAGNHDAYITQWAEAAKAWGRPFFLRFDHEMNGWWQFPWSERLNGNKPGEFVQAWRHVHDIFTSVGATNVTWVWAANISSEKTTLLADVYPGDEYVDWVGMDGYNFGSDRGNIWQTFSQVFAGSDYNTNKNTYQQLQDLAPGKPIMIAELASSEDGGPAGRPTSKAGWIGDALAQLPANFPKIRAMVWFNWNADDPEMDWPIDSSQEAVDAFAAGISSSYYSSNEFASLDTSPMP